MLSQSLAHGTCPLRTCYSSTSMMTTRFLPAASSSVSRRLCSSWLRNRHHPFYRSPTTTKDDPSPSELDSIDTLNAYERAMRDGQRRTDRLMMRHMARDRLVRQRLAMLDRMLKEDPVKLLFGPSMAMLEGRGLRNFWRMEFLEKGTKEGWWGGQGEGQVMNSEKSGQSEMATVKSDSNMEDKRASDSKSEEGFQYDPISGRMVPRRPAPDTLEEQVDTHCEGSFSVNSDGSVDIPVKPYRPHTGKAKLPASNDAQDNVPERDIQQKRLEQLFAEGQASQSSSVKGQAVVEGSHPTNQPSSLKEQIGSHSQKEQVSKTDKPVITNQTSQSREEPINHGLNTAKIIEPERFTTATTIEADTTLTGGGAVSTEKIAETDPDYAIRKSDVKDAEEFKTVLTPSDIEFGRRSVESAFATLPKDDIDFLSADEIRAKMGTYRKPQQLSPEQKVKERGELEKRFAETQTEELDQCLKREDLQALYSRGPSDEQPFARSRVPPKPSFMMLKDDPQINVEEPAGTAEFKAADFSTKKPLERKLHVNLEQVLGGLFTVEFELQRIAKELQAPSPNASYRSSVPSNSGGKRRESLTTALDRRIAVMETGIKPSISALKERELVLNEQGHLSATEAASSRNTSSLSPTTFSSYIILTHNDKLDRLESSSYQAQPPRSELENTLGISDVLYKLDDPGRFYNQIQDLQAQGYRVTRVTTSSVILKHDEREKAQHLGTTKSRGKESPEEEPIDVVESEPPQQQPPIQAQKQVQYAPNATQRVRRTEEVFSGGKLRTSEARTTGAAGAKGEGKKRVLNVAKVTGKVAVCGIAFAYVMGVLSELMRGA